MPSEKEKAYFAFEKLIQRELLKTKKKLEERIVKEMNATDNQGNVYSSEAEVNDAYGYDMITESERRRLLKALEYRENRPKLKEDYYFLLCTKALGVLLEMKADDEKENQRKERLNLIADIERRGRKPRYCACCGEVIGEVVESAELGTKWYDNHTQCGKAHVCKRCLNQCGSRPCKFGDEKHEGEQI